MPDPMNPQHSGTPYEGREPSNADLARMLSELHKDQREVRDVLLGTLKPPQPGLVEQIRVLKEEHRAAGKLMWGALMGAMGAAGVTLWNILTGGHSPPPTH